MKSAPSASVASARMNLLLVGSSEKNYEHLYDVMARPINAQFKLDHARNLEEALPMLKRSRYDLLLCDYETGAYTALRTVSELRKAESRLPVIFLSDHVNHASLKAVAEESAHQEDQVSKNIIEAVDAYCNERQLQKTEDMLRKLGRAVEQSADLVVITDNSGTIEYVNPAFETVTGYTRSGGIL